MITTPDPLQTTPDPLQTTWPPAHHPVRCRCGELMVPALDLHRCWQFTDAKAHRSWTDDYAARTWDCPACGRRLDITRSWSEPLRAPALSADQAKAGP